MTIRQLAILRKLRAAGGSIRHRFLVPSESAAITRLSKIGLARWGHGIYPREFAEITAMGRAALFDEEAKNAG